MSIFKKKYDLKKDNLYLRFDRSLLRYKFYKNRFDQESIPYKELSRKTQNVLDQKNMEVANNPDKMQEEIRASKESERQEFLSSKGMDRCFEVLSEADDNNMSEEMRAFLETLTKREDIVLGIHRTRVGPQKDIFEKGLTMTSHINSGVQSTSGIRLTDNVSVYADNKTIIKELMYADSYKSSTGSYLIEIPLEDFDKNLFVVDSEGTTRLNPKYILGYVPVEENNHISRLITARDIGTYDFASKETYSQALEDKSEFEIPNSEYMEEPHKHL